MSIARKIQRFMNQASWIRKMFEEGDMLKAKVGAENVYDFTLGNPSVDPPNEFQEILKELASFSGKAYHHHYMSNAGYMETRAKVAEDLREVHKCEIKPEHVIMTAGAAGAINVVLKAILDPEDEVLVQVPYFVEYKFYIDNHGGRMVPVETKEDFSLDLDRIESALTPKTRAVIINSPNNPTGRVYNREVLNSLGELLRKYQTKFNRDIYLISDEPYRHIIYDNIELPSIFSIYENSIICTSYSKDLSIAGERIGYAVVNPNLRVLSELLSAMIFINRILGFVNAPAFMQRLIARIKSIRVDPKIYQAKRDIIFQGLTEAGYRVIKPEGSFYIFPWVPISDEERFFTKLRERNILVVPGRGFGRSGHFRIAFCVSDTTIERAIEGFTAVFKELRAA